MPPKECRGGGSDPALPGGKTPKTCSVGVKSPLLPPSPPGHARAHGLTGSQAPLDAHQLIHHPSAFIITAFGPENRLPLLLPQKL